MKVNNRNINFPLLISLLLCFILVSTFGYAQVELENRSKLIKPETEIPGDIFWHVKAYRPEAHLIEVKAINKDGDIYPVKAIQTSDNTNVLNVKAIINGKRLPIKVLHRGDALFHPVKAIKDDGTLISIKAIAENGQIMDVKGVSRSGNIIHLKAISKNNNHYRIVALSPLGEVGAIQGLKMLDSDLEAVINGVSIFAHVKSIRLD